MGSVALRRRLAAARRSPAWAGPNCLDLCVGTGALACTPRVGTGALARAGARSAPCWRKAKLLPLHIRQLRGNFPSTHSEDIHSAHVPGLAVARLPIHPPHHCPIAGYDGLLSLEAGVRIARKPCSPELSHGGFALHPPSVGRGRRVLEYRVVGQKLGQSVRIMPVERLIEAVYHRS